MPNHQEDQHTLNQKRKGIVYFFADHVAEISLQEFLLSCNELTEKDFEHWKFISDHMRLEERRASGRENYKNVNLDSVLHENALKVLSAEEVYLQDLEQTESETNARFQLQMAIQAIRTLKRKQKRRFLLYVVHQLSLREIAEIEGISHVAVHLSIQSARQKIKEFLENSKNEQKTP